MVEPRRRGSAVGGAALGLLLLAVPARDGAGCAGAGAPTPLAPAGPAAARAVAGAGPPPGLAAPCRHGIARRAGLGRPAMPAEAVDGVREIHPTLRELGLSGPMQLRGVSDLQGVQFGLRADEVVTEAKLSCRRRRPRRR